MSYGMIGIWPGAGKNKRIEVFNYPKVTHKLALAATCKTFRESLGLFYNINTFSFTHGDTLKGFIKIIGDDNASALRNIKIGLFADTRVKLSSPFKGNQAARDRLRFVPLLAKKYGWKAVKVKAAFTSVGFRVTLSFNLLKPEEPLDWTYLDLPRGHTLDLTSVHDNFADPEVRLFATRVWEEMQVWKEILMAVQ